MSLDRVNISPLLVRLANAGETFLEGRKVADDVELVRQEPVVNTRHYSAREYRLPSGTNGGLTIRAVHADGIKSAALIMQRSGGSVSGCLRLWGMVDGTGRGTLGGLMHLVRTRGSLEAAEVEMVASYPPVAKDPSVVFLKKFGLGGTASGELRVDLTDRVVKLVNAPMRGPRVNVTVTQAGESWIGEFHPNDAIRGFLRLCGFEWSGDLQRVALAAPRFPATTYRNASEMLVDRATHSLSLIEGLGVRLGETGAFQFFGITRNFLMTGVLGCLALMLGVGLASIGHTESADSAA